MDSLKDNHDTQQESLLKKRQTARWPQFAMCVSVCLILLLCASLFFRIPVLIEVPVFAFVFVFAILLLSISWNNEQHPLRGDVLCAFIIIIGTAGNLLGVLWFYSGTTALSDGLDLDLFLLLARPGIVLLFIGFFVYLLIRFYQWSDDLKQLIIRFSFIIVVVLAYIVKSYLYEPGSTLFMKGLARTMNSKIEISSIQNWLSKQKIPAKKPDSQGRTAYYLKEVDYAEITPKEQPEYVKKFSNNRNIYILYNQRKKELYTLRAGSALCLLGLSSGGFQWRVVIGSPTMEIPPLKESGQEAVQLSPGVYVWCSYQRYLFRN